MLEMAANEYKVISVDAGLKRSEIVEDALSILFESYSKKDIYYLLNGQSVEIYLKSLNLNKFSSDTKKIINQHDNHKDLSRILGEIVRKIESIKSYGIKGGKRIYVNYNQERKVKGRKGKEENRLAGKSKQKTAISPSNQLPSKYKNAILCEDSLTLLKRLPDNCIDLIFTSPPYNFGLEYKSTQDAQDWNGYFEKLFKIFDEGIRVLKYGGRFIVNIQPLFSDYIPSHHIVSNYFLSKNMLWKGEILWEKNNYNCKYTSWGSWKSPSSPYLKYTWEFLEVFAKDSLKKPGSSENADISGDEFKKWVVAKWSIAPERKMKQFGHPAMFPEELAERAIKLFSFKGDIVLDPFNGVGTTTAVAKRLGREYIGIDISKDYCNKANKRLKQTLL